MTAIDILLLNCYEGVCFTLIVGKELDTVYFVYSLQQFCTCADEYTPFKHLIFATMVIKEYNRFQLMGMLPSKDELNELVQNKIVPECIQDFKFNINK